MKLEKLTVVEIIPFSSFKEKIKLTKQYRKHRTRIIDDFIYVQKWRWM